MVHKRAEHGTIFCLSRTHIWFTTVEVVDIFCRKIERGVHFVRWGHCCLKSIKGSVAGKVSQELVTQIYTCSVWSAVKAENDKKSYLSSLLYCSNKPQRQNWYCICMHRTVNLCKLLLLVYLCMLHSGLAVILLILNKTQNVHIHTKKKRTEKETTWLIKTFGAKIFWWR